MNLNLDGSTPWFNVHFTLPNQGNKRCEVNYDSHRKRIKDLIQNNDAFLASTNQRSTNRSSTKKLKKSKGECKCKTDDERPRSLASRKPLLNEISFRKSADTQKKIYSIENKIFIDTQSPNTSKQQERKSILPTLEGRKAGVIVCCPEQQDSTTEAEKNQDELEEPDKRTLVNNIKSENKLSIAECYDLCNWKPQSSLCKHARPRVSILKQNSRFGKRTLRPQGQTGIPSDSSEISGNDIEREITKKKVRFAKGTKFSPSSTSRKFRKKRNKLDSKIDTDKESSSDENNLEGMIELSFHDFIQRKRLERSKAMNQVSKGSNLLCFLKEERNKLPKVNVTSKRRRKQRSKINGSDEREDRTTKEDTVFPTVVN